MRDILESFIIDKVTIRRIINKVVQIAVAQFTTNNRVSRELNFTTSKGAKVAISTSITTR